MKKTILFIVVLSVVILGYLAGQDNRANLLSYADYRLLTIETLEDSLKLRQKSRPWMKNELESTLFDCLRQKMSEMISDSTNGGVGLAAPQLGVHRCLIMVKRFDKKGEPFEFYINPRIEYYSKEKQVNREGCFSTPGIFKSIQRAQQIRISYLDIVSRGMKIETISDFTAVIFQHEIDHLNGILFTDRESE